MSEQQDGLLPAVTVNGGEKVWRLAESGWR